MNRTTRTTRHPRTRVTSALAGGLAAALLLAGCGGDATGNEAAVADDGSVDLSKVTLIVGDQKGGSKAQLSAAGLLDDVEYDIQWQEFTSGPPLLEALNAGSIHVGYVGNTPPLFAAAAQGSFRAVQAVTYGGVGDAIVVPKGSDIQSVADLEGKKVAVADGSSANYHLLAQLEEAGLKWDDIEPQPLQPADALAAFTSGHVDAWAIWEPFTSQAEVDADARVIADGSKVTNGYGFQVASDSAIEDPATRAALEDYIGRISEAQLWGRDHKEEWAAVWAEETGLTEEITLAAVTKRVPEIVPIDPSVIASEQEMADAFVAAGLLPDGLDVSEYFIDDFNEFTKGG